MKYVMAILLLLFSLTAHAGMTTDTVTSAGFNKLTEQQKAEIISDITAKAAQTDTTTPQKINEWVNIGTNIGKGLAGAAHELGVQVNEFAKTDVGKMTVFLIFWHFMGSMAIHVISGAILFVSGMLLAFAVYKGGRRKTVTYDGENRDILGRNRVLSVEYGSLTDDRGWAILWIFVLTVFTSMLVTFSW